MSSLRNAIKRVTHKERAQPTARKHLGLLEKHSDYKQRANNFHKKEKRIKALNERAQNRNPDEFYMAMNSSQVDAKTGQHKKTDAALLRENMAELGADAIKVMKTQDLKYLRAVVSRDKKKEERLRSSLHFDHTQEYGEEVQRKNKKTLFVDGTEKDAKKVLRQNGGVLWDEEEEEGEGEEDDNDFDNDSSLNPQHESAVVSEPTSDDEYDLDISTLRAANKKPKTEAELKKINRRQTKIKKRIEKNRLKSYAELRNREERRQKVEVALAYMETEKNMNAKGAKRKVVEGDSTKPPVYKWRRKRAK